MMKIKGTEVSHEHQEGTWVWVAEKTRTPLAKGSLLRDRPFKNPTEGQMEVTFTFGGSRDPKTYYYKFTPSHRYGHFHCQRHGQFELPRAFSEDREGQWRAARAFNCPTCNRIAER